MVAKIAKILLPLPFDRNFDYAIPNELGDLEKGDYVKVPFGKKKYWGVCWELSDSTNYSNKIKAIEDCLKNKSPEMPNFPNSLMKLVDWQASYTMQKRGDVLNLCINNKILEDIDKKSRKLKSPYELVDEVRNVSLSDSQKEVLESILKRVRESEFTTSLIDGVTGSGKTEVYFEIIKYFIKQNRQCLILLPEIVLSKQIIERFISRFGFIPEIWNSSITDAQKRNAFKNIATGKAKVIIGARSALHLPYLNLGCVIIDEEHDSSYKQEDQVIYNARDMAIVRANIEKSHVILASATPSIESYNNAISGKFDYYKLESRFSKTSLPDINIVDMREEKLTAKEFISSKLISAIEKSLKQQKQTLLYLNRRGYSPLTLCDKCGYRFTSPDSSSWMVMHYDRNNVPYLECHHSGFKMRLPEKCPKCEAEDSFRPCGPGIQRIAEEIKKKFPDAKVLELSSDNSNLNEIDAIIKDIKDNKYDIIIGTQILAKGHHFPDLNLVGVIDGDLGLDFEDLRAGEKTFQLLHQVSGRAGREKDKGEVLIQTYNPDNEIIKLIAKNDKDGFLKYELNQRKELSLPPYSKLIGIIIQSRDEEKAKNKAIEVGNIIRGLGDQGKNFEIYGPSKAVFYKLRGFYRFRLLIKSNHKTAMQNYLQKNLENIKFDRSVKIKFDVDPYTIN
jgi:primosomal protein N' (replication factor Y)